MSSYFDEASLVMIPSGYKTSKLYSIKPTDGSGDMVVTRSNDTATRVGPDGLIEKVRTNVLLQSNTFSTTWTNANTTETSGQAGYDGTNNAWLLDKSAGSGYITQTISLSGVQTFSVYAKAGTDNWMVLLITGFSAYYDLQNGVLGTVAAGATATITSVGSGWYRCTISASATTTGVRIYPAEGNNNTSGTSGNILIQASQLESGDIMTDYIATTTAAVSVGPVANVPRLDYLNSSCPRLLLEPQRTNNALYSEQFSNAAWSKNQSTISSNSAISPDGYMSADKLIEDSSNAFHDINQLPFSTTSGQTYTFSIFVKPDTRSKIRIGYGALVNFDAFGGDVSAIIDVSNKTVISSVLSPTVLFSDFENGYVRVTFLKQATGSGQFNLIFGLVNNSNAASYLGDGSSGLFIWGAQMEAGAYATSYIPTLGAAVTRGADAASKTGISSLIGQTEGTLFLEFDYNQPSPDVNGRLLQVYATNDTTNAIVPLIFGAGANVNRFQLTTFSGGGTAVAITASAATVVPFGRQKFAIAYNAGAYTIYRNGSLFASGSGLVPASLTAMDLGGSSSTTRNLCNPINQALLFKTRLTNAELAALTA